MAKISNTFPFNSSFGNFSVYKMHGVDRLVIRAKHGPSKETLKNDPAYAKFRLVQTEFGGASKARTQVTSAIFGINHLAHPSLGGSLTSICKIIQGQDDERPLGKRSVLFSKYGSILSGIDINKSNLFESVVKAPIAFQFDDTSSATVTIPALHPGITLTNPWQLPYFRFIICLGVVVDMAHNGKKYAPVNASMKQSAVQVQTEWFSSKSIFHPITQQIALRRRATQGAAASLLLSIGIEFGMPVAGNVVEGVKRAGTGKLMGLMGV